MFQVTFDILVITYCHPHPPPLSPPHPEIDLPVPIWVYFGKGEDFKPRNHVTVRKRIIFYSRNQATKNSLNEATLLMSMK